MIIDLSARHRLPAVYAFRFHAQDDGLASYGIDQVDQWRSGATYVDRFLCGTKASDLPVQQPTKYELVINLKTARRVLNSRANQTARAPSAIRELYALPEVNRSKLNKNGSPSMSIERLADVLIASRCGAHSLGLVYEFLLKSHGNPKQARADFVMFLSGELPSRLLKEAQLWVSEEQGCEPPASIEDPIMATEHAGDPSCVPQASSNSRYEPIQASW